MSDLVVYEAEKEAGLTDAMQRTVAICTAPIKPSSPQDKDAATIKKIVQFLQQSEGAEMSVDDLLDGQEAPDLSLLVSILASAGWNLNDDIFVPAELWKARHTPKHKPINDGHDDTSILGHIIDSRAVDKAGAPIEMDTDEPPMSDFDIEVAGVLYSALPSLKDRIAEIMELAATNEMFVSMEAWFTNFAYGLYDPANQVTKIVPREEATAFLTKHLRVFGGTGEFNGHRLGRVLMDITFGGQGLVDVPANPESVIKVAAERCVASVAFTEASVADIMTEGGEDNMTEAEMKAIVDEKDAALADLQVKIDELTTASDQNAEQTEAKVAEITATVAELTTKLEEATAAQAEIAGQLKEATERADAADSKLAEIELDKLAAGRLVQLQEVTDVEDVEATLAELRSMTEDTFATVLKYARPKVEVAEEPAEESAVANEEEPKEEEDEDAGDEEDAGEAEAALDDATVNDEPDCQPGNESPELGDKTTAVALAHALFGQDLKEN